MSTGSTQLSRLYQTRIFGADIGTTDEGDLLISGGDFGLSEAESKVVTAFVRELASPPGILARYTYDRTGVSLQNEDYGNGAYRYLSENLDQYSVNEIKEGIREVGRNHPIVLLQLDETIVSGPPVRLVFVLRFRLMNQRELTLFVSPESDRLAIGGLQLAAS